MKTLTKLLHIDQSFVVVDIFTFVLKLKPQIIFNAVQLFRLSMYGVLSKPNK